MRRLNVDLQIVEARSALLPAIITDDAAPGTLIAGYQINVVGTSAKAGPLNPITEMGAWSVASSLAGNLLSENHFGYITERTRAAKGSTRFIQSAAIADPIDLSFFLDFDISGNGSHGNVKTMGPGEKITFTLPALSAADVQAGTVYEIHRIVTYMGRSDYTPKWAAQGFTMTDIRLDLPGRVAAVLVMPASVTPPARMAFLDSNEKRKCFCSWNGGLAFTNAHWDYDQDEAGAFFFPFFSDNPESILKCMGNIKTVYEVVGGAGVQNISFCTVEPAPKVEQDFASEISAGSMASTISAASRTRVPRAIAEALINAGMTSAPINPETSAKVTSGLAVQPRTMVKI